MTDSWQEVWRLRAKLYSFLGNCLLEPIQGSSVVALSAKFWEEFPLGPGNEHLQNGLEQLRQCTTKLDTLGEEEAIHQVMLEYTPLFLGPGRPQAPPWESVYRTSQNMLFGAPTFEVREALSHYGLEIRGKNKQPEDHIGLELMFLAAVSERLSEPVSEKHASYVREQIRFIDEHLLAWVPDLCRDAQNHGNVGFYGGLIELVWGILLWDKELLQEYLEK